MHFAAWFAAFFGWPLGGVWSNILASFIWSALVWLPALRHLHHRADAQHAEIVELHEEAKTERAEIKRHLGVGE